MHTHPQDRVETSPEQMAACTALAESLSSSTGLFTRVLGWYHSHPHITVLPSHVDVNTQVRQGIAAAAAANVYACSVFGGISNLRQP